MLSRAIKCVQHLAWLSVFSLNAHQPGTWNDLLQLGCNTDVAVDASSNSAIKLQGLPWFGTPLNEMSQQFPERIEEIFVPDDAREMNAAENRLREVVERIATLFNKGKSEGKTGGYEIDAAADLLRDLLKDSFDDFAAYVGSEDPSLVGCVQQLLVSGRVPKKTGASVSQRRPHFYALALPLLHSNTRFSTIRRSNSIPQISIPAEIVFITVQISARCFRNPEPTCN
jgi:hypothetical protein